MGNVLSIVKHNIRMFFKEPSGIILLLSPIFLSVLCIKFMGIDTMSIQGEIGIYSSIPSNLVTQIQDNLKEKSIEVTLYEENTLIQDVEEEKIDVGLNISSINLIQDMSEGKKGMEVVTKKDSPKADNILNKLDEVLGEVAILAKLSHGDTEQFEKLYEDLRANTIDVHRKDENTGEAMATSAFSIFVMMLLFTGTTSLRPMIREKELKVYERIGIAPIKKYEYVLGHAIGCISILSVQIILEWILLRGMNLSLNLGFITFFGIGVILAIISIGFGLLILSISENSSVFYTIVGFSIAPLCMISDCIFPLEFLPTWLDKISIISPIRWIMNSYNSAIGNKSIDIVLGNLLIASILGVLMILISIVIESRKGEKSW